MQLSHVRCLLLALSLLLSLLSSVSNVLAQEAGVEVSGGLRSSLYLDSDHTTIVTTSTDATSRFNQQWQVGAHYLLDVVSSASVDVVTQATEAFDDVRHELGASAGYRDELGRSLIGSYSVSTENDWLSHNVALSGSVEAMQRNLSLGLSLALQDNTITRSDTFGFEESMRAYIATGSFTLTASPRDLVHMALTVAHHDGFQASPYRYLTIRNFGYAENVPEVRDRVALVGRYHRHLGGDFFLRTHARIYADTYGVKALTGGTELAYERDGFDLSGFVRGYSQSAAEFYQRVYADQQRYMTLDKEMSTFWDVFAGLVLGWTLRNPERDSELRFEARVAGNYFQFADFARLDDRYGLTATLGASGRL